VPVEAEVAREVVPRAGRHADERNVAGDRHRGDRRERAVAAGDAERLRARRARARERLDVVPLAEHARLDPTPTGLRRELFGARATRARALVDEQEPGHGRRLGLPACKVEPIGPWPHPTAVSIISA
jgi:hypothetical protein